MYKKNTVSYLRNLFDKVQPYVLTIEDNEVLQKGKLEFVLEKLGRKKFRRRKLDGKTKESILQKVEASLRKNIPLHFVIPFGGYKHFWNPSHPSVDWAELFNFRYLTDYLLPILKIYTPGAIIEYISEDLIIPRMNNYPKKTLEIYSESFKELLSWYSKLIPNNLQFRYFRVGDRYDKTLIIKKVETLLRERRPKFEELTQEEKERELRRSYRSIMWKGEKDLTTLSDKQKQEKIVESRLIELAYYDVEAYSEFLGDYLGGDNHICILFSFGLSHDNVYNDLTLGSTYSSIVDFWIGRGILEDRGTKIVPRIVSHTQCDSIKDKLVRVKTNLVPIKNFQTIEVYKGELVFK